MIRPDDEVQHTPTRRYGDVRQTLPDGRSIVRFYPGGLDEVVWTSDLEPAKIPAGVRYGI